MISAQGNKFVIGTKACKAHIGGPIRRVLGALKTPDEIQASIVRMSTVFPTTLVFEEMPIPRQRTNPQLYITAYTDPRAFPLGLTDERAPGVLRPLRGSADQDPA